MSVFASTLSPGAGRRFGPGVTAKVDTGQSPDFAVMESRLLPRWAGPPPHLHRAYDEAMYVLDGEVRFTVDGEVRDLPAGSLQYVPRGIAHGFANPGPTASTILVIATPGVLEMVEETYELMNDDGSFDPHALRALFERHHSELFAPQSTP